MASGVQAICGYAGCEVNELNVDEEMIRKYVRYQEEKEKQYEQLKLNL